MAEKKVQCKARIIVARALKGKAHRLCGAWTTGNTLPAAVKGKLKVIESKRLL
jgi:hypothetical protein